MIDKIDVLQHCECGDLFCHSCKKSYWLLCIVAYHHESVIQLGKDCFDSIGVRGNQIMIPLLL